MYRAGQLLVVFGFAKKSDGIEELEAEVWCVS
jgi:hypothetical protein